MVTMDSKNIQKNKSREMHIITNFVFGIINKAQRLCLQVSDGISSFRETDQETQKHNKNVKQAFKYLFVRFRR